MFKAFEKIPRLTKNGCLVTEKIDGTNAQIYITPYPLVASDGALKQGPFSVFQKGLRVGDSLIVAGSRKRWVTRSDDNYGLATWVWDHAEELVEGLGEGRHFGEWWGAGIQRRYGLDHKRFSLFNSGRWYDTHEAIQDYNEVGDPAPECCHVVPVLYTGPFDTARIEETVTLLGETGSRAAPGFMTPEGIIVYHISSRQMFKKTLDGDGHKGNRK